jgi:hypothetical protein
LAKPIYLDPPTLILTISAGRYSVHYKSGEDWKYHGFYWVGTHGFRLWVRKGFVMLSIGEGRRG